MHFSRSLKSFSECST